MKGTGWLENVSTDTNSAEHNKVFSPNAAEAEVNEDHHGKQKDNDMTP